MMLKICRIIAVILCASSFDVFAKDKSFPYFIAGNYASSEVFLSSIESFDEKWGKQIGAYLQTINLDPIYQNLMQDYKKCIFIIIKDDESVDINIDDFFKKSQSKCQQKIIKIQNHIKLITKKD